jgi:hypothetical protein
MTDQRTPPIPDPDAEERAGDVARRRTADGPDARSVDADEGREPNPLLREGPDAPDAADIEDPDEQL